DDLSTNVRVNSSRIAELHIPAANQMSRQLLLSGILRELNNNDDSRWACWIANTPVKSLLSESARKTGHHLLQVLARETHEIAPLAIRALQSGRSHTVVVLLNRLLNDSEYQQLELAARKGEADCLIIRIDS
ncbi:MAG: cell division inhibitor SulA, partial [Bacteroidia bacterium]